MLRKLFSLLFMISVVTSLTFGVFLCIQYNQLKPEYGDSYPVNGLRSEVIVGWDSSGVIHIDGDSEPDVIFASGFVAAKERLWQMELTRRLAKGSLSEIFGYEALEADKLFLTLGIDSLTREIYSQVSPASKLWLEKYAEGVNAYLEQIADNLPVEFILMNFVPEKWSPQDCLLQNRIMAWILNFNWKSDLLYWHLSQKLPQSKFQDIWPEWAEYPAIIASEDTEDLIKRLNTIQDIINNVTGMKEVHTGSNSWVISPRRSANGFALMANDPHLRIQFPSIWIEFNLKSPELNVAGFSLPGTPGIVIGRNENISWGLTSGMVDDCDFFIEKIDTVAGIYYRDNKKRLLSVYKRSVKIKDRPDYHFKVYYTENGPIFNSSFAGMESTKTVSLKWVGFQKSDELSTFIGFAKARNWVDFENSLKSYGVPAQNFVFADRSGAIGYRLGGLIPIRSYETGLLPQENGSSQSSWKGWIPFSKMPVKKNPAAGFIVTANNKMVENFQYYISELWEPPFRAIRINQQIVESDKLDKDDIERIQTDNTNLMAQEILPLLLAEIPEGKDHPKFIEKIHILLKNWDYRMDENSVAAAVFEVWVYCLIENIFMDEMGQPAFELFTDLPNFYLRIFYQTVTNNNSTWFDDVRSTAIEKRSDIIYKSFNDALQLLIELRGEHLEDWYWGEIHQLKLMHVLGRVALTNSLLNRGPFPASGSGVTVNAATYAFDSPFSMISGPSCRFIVDWSEPENYYSILPGGNSGNFLSQFYDNQVNSWLTGGVKRVNLHSNRYVFSIKLIPETK